ncbi:ATP synthase F1 subunit delta [Hydrogenothermus marinus]|uniref:ATP synthase subunit delta n=1 Tax=Hydrogenothermus marinus TaxID=133270 RepID=A0A3M0C4N9_9AQUI|nr:ATP synthase F1 subunit delta [Hydrogenothermus marinus]RMA97902.1 F-type H+-transporting ATPase subunit delta [Hydrogenothermus marinus]
MKIDKKLLKRVVKVLLNKLPKEEAILLKAADDLELFQFLYKKNKDFRNFLLEPKLDVNKKLEFLDKFGKENNINETVLEAVKYITKVNRANLLKVLSKEFRFEIEKFFGTVKGEIITAYEIEEDEIKEVKDILEKKIGKKVEFEIKKDPSIIGGIVVKAGSYILDASIKSFLNKLAYNLTR